MSDQARFSTAVAISLALHMMLLTILPLLRNGLPEMPRLAPVEVELVPVPRPAPPPPPAPRMPKPDTEAKAEPAPAKPPNVSLPDKQIVAPSDAGEEKEPEKTRLLSDRNNTVREETVQRGEGKPGSQAAREPAAVAAEKPRAARPERPAPPARQEHEQVAALPSLDRLLPNAGDLARQAINQPPPAKAERPPPSGRDLLASGNAGSFSSRPGTMDFLPTIREGSLTMLNTKADLFAPFVRRVAQRVFDSLSIAFNYSLRRRSLHAGHETAKVEAIMDRSGHLVSARLIEHSGATGLDTDRELLNATHPNTFFDANPPSGAEANDGNIHFILLVDITVDISPEARGGAGGYGYYGIAGVGLL